MEKQEVLLEWQEPTFVVFTSKKFKQSMFLAKGMRLRILEVIAYFSSVRGIMWLALILTCAAMPMLLFGDKNSEWHRTALQIIVVVVGVRIFFKMFLHLVFIAVRSHNPQTVICCLTRQELLCTKGEKLDKRFQISDIKRVHIKEVRYNEGRRWLLRIKHKNRRWYEIGIPENLRASAQRAFEELAIPFAISSKPTRRWLN